MKRAHLIAAAVCAGVGLAAHAACAQNATTVQLPTFSFFTVNTTVSVPDRGEALLGGINRASSGRTSRGAPILGKVPGLGRGFRNDGIGFARGSSMISARAHIIDHAELDEMILGEAAARRSGSLPVASLTPEQRRAEYLTRHVARGYSVELASDVPAAPKASGPSPADIARRNALASDSRKEQAVFFFEKAEAAEAQGKTNVASIYYKMAASRATGDFKDAALARLNALKPPALAGR